VPGFGQAAPPRSNIEIESRLISDPITGVVLYPITRVVEHDRHIGDDPMCAWLFKLRADRGVPRSSPLLFIAQCSDVEVLSSLDLAAIPPFIYAHDHFGYRDRLSQPVIEGSGEVPTPGSGAPLKPGEFILGYPDEAGPPANLPQPETLSRNGSYMAYRRLQEHVGRFREFSPERWHSRGAGAFGSEAHGSLAEWRASRTVP
jgi:hypothetical protein